MRRRLLYFLLGFVILFGVSVLGGGLWLRHQLRASLPRLDGTLALAGLTAPVSVDRDRLGIPTVTAATRADAARALGFLHAQDRFFQMDLQRRQSAGELAALFGNRAVDVDRGMRVHRFRHIAREAVARTTPSYRAILDAYADGVNAGLASLGAAPPEYLLLRAQPAPWKAEDTLLTTLAMFNTLQGRQVAFESTFGTMAETLPPPMYEFLTARGSEWDAPVEGGVFVRPPIPGADVFDLRKHGRPNDSARLERSGGAAWSWPVELSAEEESGLGSNNWAVSGAHTASGAVLVANDMHLAINVPIIWYRATLVVPDARDSARTLTITGVTLPGIPSVVVGSNGHVAWGFTNTGGDWSDLVRIDPDPRDKTKYLTPDGPRPIERIAETIGVMGTPDAHLDVEWTIWGPIVRTEADGRRFAQRWVAHDSDRLAADSTAPEQSRSVEEVLRVAAGLGIPAQNFVAGDTAGTIGWTIGGPIPRRIGFDGSLPTSWADGSRGWNGYLTAEEYPRIVNPTSGRIWTANSPVVTGTRLAAIGEGGYADGIRARIIRDRLLAIERATAADMLSVQLDTSALFHERWRRLLLELLTPDAIKAAPLRGEFRRLVETSWTGRAEPASVGYLLVRTYRSIVGREVFAALSAPIKQHDPGFDYSRAQRSEGPLWPLVTGKPAHLLSPAHASWNAQLLAAVDLAIAELTAGGQSLGDRSWASFNRANVAHPLGSAVPFFGRWMNMSSDPLPGDIYTPRAHSPRAGPSERMVVSPGREAEGILHMPTGQSGHPLSPHYGDQHAAWLAGEPVPFLPGPTVSRLTLTP